MSETLYMKMSTQNSMLTVPDEHMPYIIQLHIMIIRWAHYANEAAEHLTSSYD